MSSFRTYHKLSAADEKSISDSQYLTVPPRPSVPPLPPPAGMEWVSDWEMSDEFDGDETTDWVGKHKWEISNHRWLGREPGFFKDENVFIHKDTLYLKSREETAPTHLPKSYHTFSTSFVRTHSTRLYGYFEIMCRMMDSEISSAFWFKNNEAGINTELDVFEYSTSDKKLPGGLHYERLFSTNCHVHSHTDPAVPAHYKHPKSYDLGFDLSSKRIKVGFNWQREYIEWYVNDVLIRREKNLYFHQPLHLQFDSETFPYWFGLPVVGKNSLPDHFKIHYVRAWYLDSKKN